MAWSHWVVIRLRQWYADLIGLVLRQSKTPETESNQKNVRLNNNALMTTKYSNACMVTQFQCEKCQTGQKLLCNFSISSKHSSGLQFWQLELCRVVVSKLSNQIYLQVNLIWSAESGIIQRLLQFGYSLHFCEKSFKKKSQNLGIAILRSANSECFWRLKFLWRISLTSQGIAGHLGTYKLSSTISLSAVSLVQQSRDTRY